MVARSGRASFADAVALEDMGVSEGSPAGGGGGGRAGRRRAETTWRLRRSPIVRQVLGSIAKVCGALVVMVVLITAFLVSVSGHPVAWSVIGALFVAAPLTGLIATLAIGFRAAVAAGPGWIGVRIVGHWRVLDLAQVRTVRLDDGGLGGFGFGGGRFTGRSVVLEDAFGGRVDIGLDALDAGISDVLRHGLAPEVYIDPGAALALGPAPEDPRPEDQPPDVQP